MRRPALLLASLSLALSAGCGSSGADPAPAGGCSGATPVALTVKNYLSWCSVAVGGQAASIAPSQTVCVAAGSVPVAATALTGFTLGAAPWHGTTGDAGAGDAGTVSGTGQAAMSTAAVATVAGTPACAWVCCPTIGLSDCPAASLCL